MAGLAPNSHHLCVTLPWNDKGAVVGASPSLVREGDRKRHVVALHGTRISIRVTKK